MGKNPDQEIEQIEQGLAAFLEQETCGFPETEIKTDMLAEGGIKTDMLPKEMKRPEGTPRQRRAPDGTSGQRRMPDGESRRRPEPDETPVQRRMPDRESRQRRAPDETPVQRRMPDRESRRRPASDETSGQKRAPDRESRRRPEPEEEPPRHGKKRRKKSLLKRLLLIAAVFCLLLGGLWYFLVGRVYAMMRYQEISSLAAQPLQEDGVTNILLIGNDSRSQGEDGRSDAMILLSISKKTKTIHMISLLRDMYVEIPGREGNRLNAAYSFGGPELLLETLEQNLDLTVNRYVLVNFQAFAGVVDAVGGVDLDLTNEEVQYVNGYLTEYNNLEGRPEGTDYLDNMAVGALHLNGPQALAYCRIRYIGTDFGRTERQREVLSAVLRKAPGALLTNPSGLLGGLLPNLTTNLTEAECRQLSLQLMGMLGYDLVPGSVPIAGSYKNASIRGMSVLEVDFAANKAYIRESIYGE